MLESIKQQYLFIQSKNRVAGEPYNFEIYFQNELISCQDDEVMSITLLNFDLPFDWYITNSTNNSFYFTRISDYTDHHVLLEPGNYPYRTLCKAINDQYSGVFSTYDTVSNTLVFTFQEPHTLTLNGSAYITLGFLPTDSPIMSSGNIIKSTTQLQSSSILQEVVMRIEGLTPYTVFNLDNVSANGAINISNILLAMSFTTAPFDMLTFRNFTDQNKYFFANKKVNLVRFLLGDFNDNYLDYINDFSMTFKIETYKIDDNDKNIVDKLNELIDVEKYSLMSRHLLGR